MSAREKDIITFLLSQYKRRYRTTLAPTEKNVKDALKVYDLAIRKGYGIIRALFAVYGYRHRRMENFIKEIGLWKGKRIGWLFMTSIVKVYGSYVSGRESINVELSFPWKNPLTMLDVDEDYCISLLFEALSETFFAPIGAFLQEITCALDFPILEEMAERATYMKAKEEYQYPNYVLIIEKDGKIYEYDGVFEIPNFKVNGFVRE